MSLTYENCTSCGGEKCANCSNNKFVPSVTVERACYLIKTLLKSQGCETQCPDWELCRMLRFECELACGRYNLASLSLMTAGRYLQSEALCYGRTGRFETLTIKVQADRSADFLAKMAMTWMEEAKNCSGIQKFAVVRTGKGCNPRLQINNSYKCVGCKGYKYEPCDTQKLTNCRWDCCDDCPETYDDKPI